MWIQKNNNTEPFHSPVLWSTGGSKKKNAKTKFQQGKREENFYSR
jgi:hypothetical protein